MTLVHPSYSVLVAIGLVGFLLVRALLDRRHDVRHIGAALAAIVVPAGLVVLWLLPIVRETASHSPSGVELNRAFAAYGNELDVFGPHSYRLAPELYGRAGAIAVASLLLLPLAVFAHRRLWAAFVLGAMLATFAVTLLPFVFPHFADAISISQARRIIGFSPRPYVLVGGALVLAGFLRLCAAAGGARGRDRAAAGLPRRLHLALPPRRRPAGRADLGRFGATVAALLAAALFGRRIPQVQGSPLVAAAAVGLFLIPVAVHGYSHWTVAPKSRGSGLPQKLVAAVRREVPRGDVVFSDPLTAYELSGFAPVYINAAPTTHVADTRANRPAARVKQAQRFFADHGPLSRRARGTARTGCWSTAPASGGRPSALPRVYSGSRYVLYRIPMKVLLVTMYFPPAGGGGVQRPLKLATHLPALGIETHVLAPDDPKWLHRDDELRPPTQAFVHRARYLGPKARLHSEELRSLEGFDLALAKARVMGRRLLLPDASVTWAPTAIPAAVRIVKSEGIDAVITTSPPLSMNLIGAAVKRLTGVPWIADQRDSLVQNADLRFERKSVQAKEKALERVVRLVANNADGIVAVSEAIADEIRAYDPAGPVRVIPNGSDFDDFAGLEYRPGDRFRITHTGSFFGKRNPRAFLSALASSGLEDVVARFVGDFRSVDREWVQELDLGDRLELLDYLPHRRALELQRDSEANLLLLPEAAGRGKVVPSGKIFEYLAAERPILAAVPTDGVAAQLVRETGAGVVVAPDDEDGLREALLGLHARWKAGRLGDGYLSEEQRKKLSRTTRVEELAELLWSLE